jgi:phosphoglycolate phosphatase
MTLLLPRPKAVIFDWDNTLVDSWPVIHAALEETFIAMGQKPWSFEETTLRVKKSMRDSFPELFGERWEEASTIYQQAYRARHLQALAALPGALQVLEKVKSLGLYCVVVSNKKGPTLREEAAHLGWTKWFDRLVGAGDAARDKPYADPVHFAFQAAPVALDNACWFIGDSDIDLHCAENAKCSAVLFGECTHHEGYSKSHYHGFVYHAHAKNHRELLALF